MKVKEFAKEWLGTPFKHMGRDKSGIDCLGLVLTFLRDVKKIDFKRDWKYDPLLPYNRYVLVNEFYKYVEPCEKEAGCIALISLTKNLPPTHLGIVIDENRCLHVMRGTGVVVSKLTDLNIKGYYKVK